MQRPAPCGSESAYRIRVGEIKPANFLLEDLVKSFLIAMIDSRDRFRSKQEFLSFLERQRLS